MTGLQAGHYKSHITLSVFLGKMQGRKEVISLRLLLYGQTLFKVSRHETKVPSYETPVSCLETPEKGG